MDFMRFLRDNANWLAVGLILNFTSSYGQTFFISLFAAEVRADFGLSHGQWGGAYTLGTIVSAVLMLWAGALTDRYRVRALAPIVFLGLAISCLAMAFNPFAWALPLIILALRFTGQGMSTQLSTVAMARWFSSNRGRALAVAALGFAIGQAFLPYLFVSAKSEIDWRILWMIAAGLAILAILPLTLLLRRERTPQSHAENTSSLGMAARHWTRSSMLRHPLFWFLLPSILGPAAWGTSLFFHQVHLAEVKSWSHTDFVALMPIFTAISVASTFASGWAVDRFGSGWLMACQGIPIALGFLTIFYAQNLGMLTLGLSFVAISVGTMATLPGSFAAEYYGTKYLGGIKAIWTSAMVLGSAIGPGISGVLIDFGFDFGTQAFAIGIYFFASVGLLLIGIARYAPTLSARP